MKPCRTDDGEIGNRNAFLPMSITSTVTPHTEMFNDLLKLAVESGVVAVEHAPSGRLEDVFRAVAA